jgi:hypothetical protein
VQCWEVSTTCLPRLRTCVSTLRASRALTFIGGQQAHTYAPGLPRGELSELAARVAQAGTPTRGVPPVRQAPRTDLLTTTRRPHVQGHSLLPDRTAQLTAVASSLEALAALEGETGASPLRR